MSLISTGPPRLTGVNPLMQLVTKPVAKAAAVVGVRFVWATVTMAFPDPIQVQVDTEAGPLPGVPSMLCQVGLGDRVLLLQYGRRVVVLGVAQPDQSRLVMMQSGTVTITPSAVNTGTMATVTFDSPFNQIPSVQVTAFTQVPQNVSVSYQNPSATGVNIWVSRSDAAVATTVSWQAQV